MKIVKPAAPSQMPGTLKVLCVGTPPELMHSRQLVLKLAGYDVTFLSVEEASAYLHSGRVDVVVLSVTIRDQERDAIRQSIPDGTRIVQLDLFTSPFELLNSIGS